MVGRRFIRRSDSYDCRVTAWTSPDHQAYRHWIWQARFYLPCDLEILLLIGRQNVSGFIDELVVAGRHFHLGSSQQRSERSAAANRRPTVHRRLAWPSQLVRRCRLLRVDEHVNLVLYITLRISIRRTSRIFR